MKIAIIDQPYYNRGDESAFKAFIRKLVNAFPESSFDVFFRIPAVDAIEAMDVHLQNVRYYNLNLGRFHNRIIKYTFYTHSIPLSYIYKPLRDYRNLIKKYDCVIGAPGGMNMGGFKDWLHIWFFETARRLNKPVIYWGRSIGPFVGVDYESKLFRDQSVKLLKYFSFIALRDDVSVKCANELGIQVEEIVDSAFLELPDAKISDDILQKINGEEYIVFVPNELTWHPRYKKVNLEKIDGFYLDLIELLVKKWPNRKIVMLPQTFKSSINDYSYFKRLSSKSGNKNIIVINEEQNSDIQQKIISHSKLVIGARYHSIVFAINNEVPFISLSYEHKMKGLLEKLDLSDSMIEIQNIFDEGKEDKLTSSIKNADKIMDSNTKRIDRTIAVKIVNSGFKMLEKTLHRFE